MGNPRAMAAPGGSATRNAIRRADSQHRSDGLLTASVLEAKTGVSGRNATPNVRNCHALPAGLDTPPAGGPNFGPKRAGSRRDTRGRRLAHGPGTLGAG